jgi:hypothetical protein
MKVSIEEVESTLLENKIVPEKVKSIIKQLEEVVEELKDDADKSPKQKWENVIIILDKTGELKDKELAGWVVNQHENADAGLVLAKLSGAAKNQNEAAKRKKNVITNMTELFENLKPKNLVKSRGVRIKTKELTRVVVTDGKLV